MEQTSKGKNENEQEKGKSRISNRGFASMSSEQQRQIASKGGQAAHKKGVAHEWTSEEARAAGRKGGQASKKTSRNEENKDEATEQTQNVSNNTATPRNEEPDRVPNNEMDPQRQDTRPDRSANR
jgi:general stress protein YciG